MSRIQYNGKTIQFGGSSIIKSSTTPTFSDWFLPSLDELQAMYDNLYTESVGNFSAVDYWSSSEYDIDSSYVLGFSKETNSFTQKSNTNYVRSCRSFTGGLGEYSLRDEGPSGGLIFYISGTTYYEAAPSDQSVGMTWSNIQDTLIGTTGTAIGTGQANTTAIINQAGHTDSAAKICDDLIIEN